MIIDALTHITENGRWFTGDCDASCQSLLKAMNKSGVEKAVLVGIPTKQDNRLILETSQQHPGRFIPVAGVDTSLSAREIEGAIEETASSDFYGIKIHPRIAGSPLLSEGTHTAIQAAGKLDLTAMICTIHRPPLPPLGRPVSDALYELCAAHERTRIILVHGGYYDLLATSELVRPFEHVLLDLSLTLVRFERSSIARDICYLINTFDKRITIGSDFPEGNMSNVLSALSRLGFHADLLTESGVLGKNILRFFPGITV
jgi:predicted TIM-barrel fold metal-dependent hydrolase